MYDDTHMIKTQVYLGREELDALHQVAARSNRKVAEHEESTWFRAFVLSWLIDLR